MSTDAPVVDILQLLPESVAVSTPRRFSSSKKIRVGNSIMGIGKRSSRRIFSFEHRIWYQNVYTKIKKMWS
ncbi:hypothetical protein H6P81_009814 [Aristolochia fimbriata]|uniref:Uncharacterized protein n=1 Tax=Aristolochia fimbriata TaxID=158543 RepID=A0AAV7EMV9_ARIFI|nr:hypothetical protein H6P81_009814 [Aristolochia fimbriata]